ncbi:palmitoyltransferase swf1 [Knufia fluminis]|uniref:Palmitoyltransferase n=1 Tax=Knufia fluminis TaxID=191047 RepID=A0AAN8IR85_9EURO|nr:palmitoyltransferase swf1 [Knufia fluminis]
MPLLRQLAQSDSAMEMIKTIAWVVGTVSFIVFIALFGRLPIFRRTPIGWTHRLLLHHLPQTLIKLDRTLTSQRITRSLTRLYNYLLHDRHPVVMIIFILLQSISEILFIPPATPYLSATNKYILLPTLITLPYLTLYLSYSTTTHHITAPSYPAALTRYPYDYTLYHPHQPCRTCQTPKPARSKHCPICKTCIERQDHHCIWINNCVGLHNYHHFIGLLLSISALLAYGTITGFSILDTILQDAFVPDRLTRGSRSAKRWSTGLSYYEWANIYSVAIASNARIGAVTLLATMTFPLALGFLVYHAYLIWLGCTTNETAKWTDLREDIWDGLVWKARIQDVKVEYPGSLDEGAVYDPGHYLDQDGNGRKRGKGPVWAGGKRAEWWVIRTRGGAQPTRWGMDGDERGQEVIDERWVKVGSMKEVENIYDLGLVGNFGDTVLRGWRTGG